MESDHPKAFETIKNVLSEDNDDEVKKNAMIALYKYVRQKYFRRNNQIT